MSNTTSSTFTFYVNPELNVKLFASAAEEGLCAASQSVQRRRLPPEEASDSTGGKFQMNSINVSEEHKVKQPLIYMHPFLSFSKSLKAVFTSKGERQESE